MPKGYTLEALGVLDGTAPVKVADGAIIDARPKVSTCRLTGASLVAQGVGAINDTIVVTEIPANSLFRDITFQSDTVFTGCTLQFGIAGNATKYGSIAAPAANTLYTLRPVAARMAAQYSAPETIIITVTAAAVPAAFNAEMSVNYQQGG